MALEGPGVELLVVGQKTELLALQFGAGSCFAVVGTSRTGTGPVVDTGLELRGTGLMDRHRAKLHKAAVRSLDIAEGTKRWLPRPTPSVAASH